MTDPTELDPERWVDEHGDALYRYARARLRDVSAAEDAVQETLLAAFRSRDRFTGDYPIRAWLLGILRHKIVDHIRKSFREIPVADLQDAETEYDWHVKLFGVPREKPHPWRFDPRSAFEQKEFLAVFTDCLNGLKQQQHAAFVLKELEGQSTEEICNELKVTPNHLWVILHRARGQLKTCLEKNWMEATKV